MSDLKAPTYEDDITRRSGLYGPTAILSRSDIFMRRWCTASGLKSPTYRSNPSQVGGLSPDMDLREPATLELQR
jgi:hypothetical protein